MKKRLSNSGYIGIDKRTAGSGIISKEKHELERRSNRLQMTQYSYNIEYLVVAGGGGAGGGSSTSGWVGGGGGGAGGLLSGSFESELSITYTATVGAGGSGTGYNTNSRGGNGSDSSLIGGSISITSIGGGGGGTGGNAGNSNRIGASGGSGGGSGYRSTTAGSGLHFTGGAIFPTTGPGSFSNGGITWGMVRD